MVNDSLIITFGWAKEDEIAKMKALSFAVNKVLKKLFLDAGLILVDYKLEFGRFHNEIVLGDEFSPDGCRIWTLKLKKCSIKIVSVKRWAV